MCPSSSFNTIKPISGFLPAMKYIHKNEIKLQNHQAKKNDDNFSTSGSFK